MLDICPKQQVSQKQGAKEDKQRKKHKHSDFLLKKS